MGRIPLIIGPVAFFTVMALINVPNTYAVGIGLADGTYNISLDFTGTTYDATGTMTVTSSVVTVFQVDSNATLGHFDCGFPNCDEGTFNPDRVLANFVSLQEFDIRDDGGTNPTFNFLDLYPNGNLHLFNTLSFLSVDGTWDVTAVPEPNSALLTLFGLVALGLLVRLKVIRV